MVKLRVFGIIFLLFASFLCADNPALTINVDASQDQRIIHPEIYGVNFGSSSELSLFNSPLNRMGGNRTSGYNWLENADVTGSDWYFESYPGDSSVPGEIGDAFIGDTKSAGAEPMITIPMLDWIAKLGPNRSINWSFSINKYGAQQDHDPFWPDAGNGVLLDDSYVVNDPADAGTPNSSLFQQDWVDHLLNVWGNSSNNGVKYYVLDNEHAIWQETHRDFHPIGATYDEIKDKMIDYATMIHSQDSGVQVVGPEEFGWAGYFFSGYDLQFCNESPDPNCWSNPPDRMNHGGWLYLDWILDQLHQHEQNTGQKVLDVFSLHYYPQSGEFSDDTSPAMQNLRNRSTRSLWDPNYKDESWISDFVYLIPRMHDWVNTFYPGLKIGITEYNWGAENHMNGATAQADVLGIFGREGLDLATRWVSPGSNTPVGNAFKMYRNYDGNLSTFGDLSVRAIVPNPDDVSSFAALRTADNSLTIMVINKYISGNTPATLNFSNFSSIGIAKVWQLANNTISHLADINFAGSSFSANLPPQSITLFIVPSSAPSSLLLDEFDDDVQSWPVKKGTWVESNGILSGSGPKSAIVYAPQPWFPSGVSGCSTCTLETDVSTAGGIGNKIFVQPWYQDKQNRVDVLLKQESGKIILKQKVNGFTAQKMKASFNVIPNTFHHIKIGFDGTNFHLEVDGASLITMPAAATPSGNLYFQVKQTTASIERVEIY
jgi:glycosyl hydrolase family 44